MVCNNLGLSTEDHCSHMKDSFKKPDLLSRVITTYATLQDNGNEKAEDFLEAFCKHLTGVTRPQEIKSAYQAFQEQNPAGTPQEFVDFFYENRSEDYFKRN